MKRFLLTTTVLMGFIGAAQAGTLPADVAAPSQNLLMVAESSSGAKDFIDNMGQSAIGFLGNEGMAQAEKEAEFKKLLQTSFDMKTIGRFALGSYWNSASPQQQAEYQQLFEKMIIRVYSARFNDYKGQKLDVASARDDGKDALVTSYIVPQGGEKIQVDWRVRNKGGSYKIVDVIIEGVSMAMTQRSDFSSVIQRGGGNVQVLIEHLQKN